LKKETPIPNFVHREHDGTSNGTPLTPSSLVNFGEGGKPNGDDSIVDEA